MLSRAQFEQEILPLRIAVERRRKVYIRYFYAGAAAALLLLLTAILCPSWVLEALLRILHGPASLRHSDIVAYRLFACINMLLLPLGAIVSYRHAAGGLMLGPLVISRLLNLFGEFIPAQGGGISSGELRRAGLLAPELQFHPQEGASGEMNAVRLRVCEAEMGRRAGEGGPAAFRGLILLCDLPPAGDPGLCRHTATPESSLRQAMEELAALPKGIMRPRTRWDERLVRAGAACYGRLKDAVISHLGKSELASEKAHRLRRALQAPAGMPSTGEEALFSPYALAQNGRSRLIMIADITGFFTLGSLFVPAFSPGHLQRFYAVMRLADRLTRTLALNATSE